MITFFLPFNCLVLFKALYVCLFYSESPVPNQEGYCTSIVFFIYIKLCAQTTGRAQPGDQKQDE